MPRKVARLHLICDILHNSAASVPSAWKFRLEFQSRLGIVFDHLATIYHSFPGRITADLFKKQITSIVDIWEDWIVFPPDFTSALRDRLDGPSAGVAQVKNVQPIPQLLDQGLSKFKASGFKKTTVPTPQALETATALSSVDDVDGQPLDDDDMDGAPMIDAIDGDPISSDQSIGVDMDEDVDGEPIDDIDGEPIPE